MPGFVFWLVLIAVGLLALLVPVSLGFSLERRDNSRFFLFVSVAVLWARVRLPLVRGASVQNKHFAREQADRVQRDDSDREKPARAAVLGQDDLLLQVARWLRIAGKIYPIVCRIVRTIETFEWRTEIGTGDAASTGALAGGLWAVKGGIVGALAKNHVFLRAPRLSVIPDYNRPRFSLEMRCIFRFRLGDIIVAALQSLSRPKRG